MAARLTEMLVPKFAEAFERAAQGDNVTWDIIPFPHPQYGLSIFVGAVTPGAALGTMVSTGRDLYSPHTITDETAFEVATVLVEELRKERSNQLQQLANTPPTDGQG